MPIMRKMNLIKVHFCISRSKEYKAVRVSVLVC